MREDARVPQLEPQSSRSFNRFVKDLDPPMFVVTTVAPTEGIPTDAERSGCLIAFATQVSVDPPRFLVGLSDKNHTCRVAARADLVAVHTLAPSRRDLAELFGEETGDEVDKFERCRWTPGPGGVPLLSDAQTVFVGRILERIDFGDHVGHLLEPVDVEIEDEGETLEFQQVKDLEPGHEA